MTSKRNNSEPLGAAINAFGRRSFLKGGTAGIGAAVAALGAPAATARETEQNEIGWDDEVDVLVIGAGAAGLTAAIAARDLGAEVLVVEANFDTGGRAIVSGGGVYLGGGTSLQRQYGVEDTPEAVFRDWTRVDHRLTRWNDRDLVWAYAQHAPETYDFLVENGVNFIELRGPDRMDTVLRRAYPPEWPNPTEVIAPGSGGSGVMRPLQHSARNKGVRILLQHRMTQIHRSEPTSGPVIGITAMEVDDWYEPKLRTVNIKARKGIVIASGGGTTNVEYRRIFDPRLTEEYQVRGAGWVKKNADGELAAIAIGASLWGTPNQTNEQDDQFETPWLGKRYNSSPRFVPESPNFFRERAMGLSVTDWQNVILVKENGRRFYDETRKEQVGALPENSRAANYGFFNAALDWTGDFNKLNGGGPIWAIFDADAVGREQWNVEPPSVDPAGFFFTADTIEELAESIVMEYQWRPMPPMALRETVDRYNSFVDSGTDDDFGKPTPMFKVQTPPFYAAWATIPLHDSYVGLRVNTELQVLDTEGVPIPHLYAAGDCAGGFGLHGIGRATVFGHIAGINVTNGEALD